MRKRLIVAVTSLLGLAGVLTLTASPTPATELAQPEGPTGHVWTTVDASGNYTCGIRLDHTLWCWGTNEHGQLGLGDKAYRHHPTQVEGNDWAVVQGGT